MDLERFSAAIAVALDDEDWSAFEAWITENSSFSYNYHPLEPPVTSEEFDVFFTALCDPRLLKSDGASKLVRLFEYEWSRLTARQKKKVTLQFSEIYNKLTDPLAWFLICEILGEYCADRAAIQIISSLRDSGTDESRAFTAMAFVNLIRHADDPEVVLDARRELVKMQHDASPLVQEEVRTLLLGIQ